MKFSQEIGDSLTLKFAQIARDLVKEGKEVVSMAVGEPNFTTPKYIEEATIKALKDGYTHYSNSQGLPELRDLITKDINKKYHFDYTSRDVIVTPGVKAGLYLTLASILEPGDEVIIISPYYVSYPAIIKISEPDAKIVDIPVKADYSLDLNKLTKAFNEKTRCIIVNTPNNPSGKLLTKEEVKKIVELALQYNVYILADEVYDQLVFKPEMFYSFLEEKACKNLLIYTNGYSKSYCLTGWRIGFVFAPPYVLDRMLKLQQNINTNTNTFIQKGVCSIYEHEPDHLISYRKELLNRIKILDRFIQQSSLFKGVKPEAGFFYFVNISKSGLKSTEFAIKLMEETGVVVTPGIGFGPGFDDYVRMSLAIDDKTLEIVLTKLVTFENIFK